MNWETTKPFYGNVAKDVGYQKKRIGGNFVVAQAITSRDMRNEKCTQIPAAKGTMEGVKNHSWAAEDLSLKIDERDQTI